jgi:hypothetical protein
MTKHLNVQGRPNPRGELLFILSKLFLNPSYWHIQWTKNHQNEIELINYNPPK